MASPVLIRSKASQEGKVDLDSPCQVCGEASFGDGELDVIFCDACDSAYHFRCLRPPLQRVPTGTWTCPKWPSCQRAHNDEPAAKRTCADPTYELLKAPRFDPMELREAAGLGQITYPTSADLDRILEFRWAPRTAQAYTHTALKYEQFCQEGGLPVQDMESLCLYAVRRLQDNVSASTIRRDLIGIRQKFDIREGDAERLRRTLQAVARLAGRPDEKKLPLTPALLRELRRTIASYQSKSPQISNIRNRDWAFYLLGFAGFFRGAELTALLWDHVRFEWDQGGKKLTTLRPEPPRSAQQARPTAIVIQVVKSKGDPTGVGQKVQVAAKPRSPDLREYECPFRMLRALWREKHRAAQHVFHDPANGKGITTNTMLGRLRRYLEVVFEQRPGSARDYGLHSARRGGATQAYRNGATMQEIKAQGRWKSDVAFLYTVVSDQEALEVTRNLLQGLNL